MNLIFKNFFVLIIAEAISKILGFVTIIYVAHVLGVSGFGEVSFALAVVSYFLLIPNAGLSLFGAKGIARNKKKIAQYIDNIVSIRVVLAIIAFICLVVLIFFIPKSLNTKKLIFLYGFTLFTFALTLDWVFQGLEKMEFIAVGNVIKAIIFIEGVFFLIKDPDQVLWLPIIQVMASLVMILFFFSRTRLPRFNLGRWKEVLKRSWPMGASLFCIAIYYNLDKIMLGFIKGEQVVGWYEAAYQVILLVLILPSLILKVFFPLLSRSRKVFRKYFFSMVPLGVFVGICGIYLAPFIVRLFYGSDYLMTILPLQILFFNVIIIFANMTLGNPLLAWGKQKRYLQVIAGGAGTNLIFNFLFIPKYSLIGAAIATLLAEIAVLGGFIIHYFKYEKV